MRNNSRFGVIIIFLLFFGLCFSLIIQANEVEQKIQNLGEIVLCKEVSENNPVFETSKFYSWDEKAVCWIKYNYQSEENFMITWKWETPEGNIYHIGEIEMEKGDYMNYRSWYWIGIKEHYAEGLLGDWKVKVYIDNILLDEKSFLIE